VLAPIAEPSGHKTAELYAALPTSGFSDGSATAKQAQAIRVGKLDYGAIQSAFEPLVTERWPPARAALELLRASEALAATVTGAGPSVFGLYRSLPGAVAAKEELAGKGIEARLHRFISEAHA
ncbi:MAG TPA: hypothetical protein VGK54_13970, partial [Chloroflexota bacterium]